MSKDKQERSELVEAAEALDAQLRRFEHLVEVSRREPLNTQKNLERSARALKEVADCDTELGQSLQALVAAISKVRDRQQAQVEAVVTRAKEVEQRSGILQDLLTRYGQLGEVAGQLNNVAQQIVAQAREATTPDKVAELFASVGELQEAMGKAAGGAEDLVKAAGSVEFVDVEREAESLRQQLLASRNKLGLLQKSLAKG